MFSAVSRSWKYTGLCPLRDLNCNPLSLMSWRGAPYSLIAVSIAFHAACTVKGLIAVAPMACRA